MKTYIALAAACAFVVAMASASPAAAGVIGAAKWLPPAAVAPEKAKNCLYANAGFRCKFCGMCGGLKRQTR
jgi:hypothetical protein